MQEGKLLLEGAFARVVNFSQKKNLHLVSILHDDGFARVVFIIRFFFHFNLSIYIFFLI